VSRRPKTRPQPLGDLVPRVLGDLGYDAANALTELVERWEDAVGAEVARHARPAGLRDATLEVSVDSSVWCQQLQLRREEILAALVRELGDRAPRELWLRVG
jgi:predicted nucleic acid-binding Zn ribbon protein